MSKDQATMAQQVAQAVMAFQQQTTGHAPKAVTVVLSQDTLVVTLHEALSPGERDVAKSPEGAAKVQEFHRQLFSTSSQSLRDEIKRITGVDVREAIAEVEPMTGAVVCAFASGTMVQVFQLVQGIRADTWNQSGSADQPAARGLHAGPTERNGCKMRPMMIIGIVLIVLGVAALVLQGIRYTRTHDISYTTHEKVVDLGGVQVTAERQKTIPIPAVVGGVALAGGIAAIVIATRKRLFGGLA
jgi:uncharacterized protein YbcI